MFILLVFHLKITFQTLAYLESYIFAFSIWVANLLNFSKARTFFSSSVSLVSVVVTVLISSSFHSLPSSVARISRQICVIHLRALPWSWLLNASPILLLPVI